MVKENLDDLNREIISKINKEQKLDDISEYGEKKSAFSFLKRKRVKEEPALKPLPDLGIPKPSKSSPISLTAKDLSKEEAMADVSSGIKIQIKKDMDECRNLIYRGKIEKAKEKFNKLREDFLQASFSKQDRDLILNDMNKLHSEIEGEEKKLEKPAKKEGLFRGLFGKKKEEGSLEPLTVPKNTKPVDTKPAEKEEFRQKYEPEELPHIEKPLKEDFLPPKPVSALSTEKNLKDEGLIKSDFSLKELPAGEKEVNKPVGKLSKSTKKAKKAKTAKRKQPKTTKKSVKSKKKTTKKVSQKSSVKKAKERLDSKLSLLKTREKNLKKLQNDLAKKETAVKTKEEDIKEQEKKYKTLIRQLEKLKQETNEDIAKRRQELDKRQKELDKRERYLKRKEKEVDIEDRAVDYAMSEFEKEKMKLEDDEFHSYLKSKVADIHGEPVPKKQISIGDIEKAESLNVPDLSNRKLTIQESLQKCKDLLRQGRIDQAKFLYNGIRLEFSKKQYPEPEKRRLYNEIRELYDAINLASLNRK